MSEPSPSAATSAEQRPAAQALADLSEAWDGIVLPSSRRALSAFVFAALFGAMHLARIGTTPARTGAAAMVLGSISLVVIVSVVSARRRDDARRIIARTIGSVDPELGAAALRALRLAERTLEDESAGSADLAELHLDRLVARTPRSRLVVRAGRLAVGSSIAAMALSLGALAAVALEPFRIVEGADVLAARAHEAPLALAWVDEVEVAAAPPEYLHEATSQILAFSPASLPRGTVITVHAHPLRTGRNVVLTDGVGEVPFVDDGSGAAVARWTLRDSTSLFVAARFGDVRVRQADVQPLNSIPDLAPKVVVEGAPRTAKFIDEPSIPFVYEATDDHGLREVDLVLRSAGKEERRVLSHPAADAKSDRGGYGLPSSDKFFKTNFAPTTVTVEARDNDTVSGPKWGTSEAIIVIPPEIGEPEALRYLGLLEARDALTDLLADRLEPQSFEAREEVATSNGKPKKLSVGDVARAHRVHELEVQTKALAAVDHALGGTYGGLALRGRWQMLARSQLQRLKKALEAEGKTPKAADHEKLVAATENVLLAIDSAVRALAAHDAGGVAKKLAGVAEDAATAAASEEGDRGTSKARLDADVGVLEGGGRQLGKLGDLGRDLGEIVTAGLHRIGRARDDHDVFHAELAARDLAARLRHPDPSFSSSGGRGGVESGGGSSQTGESAEPSDADREAAAEMHELEDIASEHQAALEAVEKELDESGTPEERARFKEEAKEHAEALREAIKNLPKQGSDVTTPEGLAATGREQAEAMAGALERGDAKDAVEQGKRSSSALGEAKKLGEESGAFFPDKRAAQEAGKAREVVERELAWAEEMLEKLKRASSARSKGDLAQHAENEKQLAQRAKELAKKGDSGDRLMPQETLDHLEEAERKMMEAENALREGDGRKGADRQQEAQRLLEMAKEQRNNEGQNEEGEPTEAREGGKAPKGKTEVPGKDKHKGPEDFRKRVLEGLGGSSDPLLREAVKRYAEGLLK